MRNESKITRLLVVSCAALSLGALTPAVQQGVPIVELAPPSARTPTTFGSVLGIREVAGGKVLVNDARRKQLLMYDTTLTTSRILYDSVPGMANSYGPLGVALIPYNGDSSLMLDISSGPGSILVLNGEGQVARALALPNPMDAGSLIGRMSFVDNKGRVLYALSGRVKGTPAGEVGTQETYADSTPVLRADLDARRVDTIGRVSKNKGEHTQIDHTDAKKIIRTVIVNPLPSPDEWGVLTDGSVAFVRGHDYHIDFVRPDGSTSSTPKLPFDWKRLTDDDKQRLLDSATAVHAAQNALAAATRNAPPPPPPPPVDPNSSGGGQRTGGGAGVTRAAYDAGGTLWVPLDYKNVPMKDIPDYYPAIRQGAAMADLDNHLWILPTTSAQSKHGELIYDVVNTKGELFQRVRMPLGRQVAGFGKNGVVYLLDGDRNAGFYLERTRLPGGARP